MTTANDAKEKLTKLHYEKLIKEIFNTDDAKSKLLAADLYDQIVAHGGNPHNFDDIEKTIHVIVGKWLNR